MRRRITPDGFIVVAVLWILGALATLVSIYAVFVLDTAASFSAQEDRIRAQGLVSAALELTAYRLTGPMEGRVAHDVFGFRMGQANIAVEFRSETARIDLNAAPKELLIGLFAELGAHRVTQRITPIGSPAGAMLRPRVKIRRLPPPHNRRRNPHRQL